MFFIILIIFFVLFYFYSTRNHNYWVKRNVKHESPIPLFGNHLRVLLAKKNLTQMAEEFYNKFPDEKIIGYFRGTTPTLIITDLDIIRHILNVDFSHFYPRGVGRDKEKFLANIFHADGDKWKLLRQRLTPTFTTAKLKNMFPLIVQCAEKLEALGEDIIAQGGEFNAKDFMGRFTMEFIGACGFGLEMNAISHQNTLFHELANVILNPSLSTIGKILLIEVFPEVKKHIYVANPRVDEICSDLLNLILKQRNYKPIGRNDFIDLLLEHKERGKIIGESIEKRNADGSPVIVEMEMDFDCMMAQVFVFIAAGFETSSAATSYTLHELAFHPDIQKEIQKEIDQVLSKYDNKLCYDSISEMKLLEMAFKEAMRIFPSLGILNRVCARKYTIPKVNVTIDPGVKIIIPIKSIHNNEWYFDNPKEFRPQRFTPEASKTRHNYTYLPFGEGPRECVGSRLGLMQSLAGLATVLRKFSVEPAASTQRYVEADPRQSTVQSIRGGVPLKLTLRQNK